MADSRPPSDAIRQWDDAREQWEQKRNGHYGVAVSYGRGLAAAGDALRAELEEAHRELEAYNAALIVVSSERETYRNAQISTERGLRELEKAQRRSDDWKGIAIANHEVAVRLRGELEEARAAIQNIGVIVATTIRPEVAVELVLEAARAALAPSDNPHGREAGNGSQGEGPTDPRARHAAPSDNPPQPENLLGQMVKVTLAHGDPKAIETGRLLSFGDSGEVVLQDHMGFIHRCWPMVNVEPLPSDNPPPDR